MADGSEFVEVKDAQELRELLGDVDPRAAEKDRELLHPMQVRWIEASPFCIIGTADVEGRCDVSPKGDPSGFSLVLGPDRVVVPERPGNRRGDGFHNVLSNPHVALIYLIPGRTETLRVNGHARVLRDAPFFDQLSVKNHRPKLALLVEVEQVFFHCSKAFMRSDLWRPESWNPDVMPTHAEISHALMPDGRPLEELKKYYGEGYAEGLYTDR